MTDTTIGASANAQSRLEVVDVLRGFALSALFLVHMVESYELYWAAPKPGIITDTVFLLFLGKSFSLLALCFGFSFFILMDRAAKRGVDFTGRFAWRLLILCGIGFLHALVYRGDIIQLLAAMGFVLLLANRIRDNRVLMGMAVVCFLGPTLWFQLIASVSGAAWANQPPGYGTDPAMQVYLGGDIVQTFAMNLWTGQLPKFSFLLDSGRIAEILGLYLVGLVLGRIGFFERLDQFARARWIALGIAIVAAAGLHYARQPAYEAFVALGHGQGANRAFAGLIGMWFELAGTTIWALLVIAVYRSAAQAVTRPFAAMGRLTLTFYVGQSIVFVPVFYNYGLGLHDDWGEGTRFAVGLAAIAAQMAFAG